MMRNLLFFLFLGIAACDFTDPGVEAEEMLYRTEFVDGASGAAALSDGTFVVAGFANGRIGIGDWTNAFPLLLRVSSGGLVTDTTIYGDIRYGQARAVRPFEGGLAVLVAQANYDQAGVVRPDLTLYRTSLSGVRESVLFELPETSPAQQPLLRTADRGFLLIVSRWGTDGHDLVKLDRSGSISWTYRMPEVQNVGSVVESSNSDIFVLGVRSDSRRFDLARMTSSGQETWRQVYGNDTLRRSVAIAAVGDGVAVLGSLNEPKPGVESVVIARFDGAGRLEWERKYAKGDISASALTSLPDGGLAFGYRERYGERGSPPGQSRSFIVRLAPNGAERWRRPFGPREGTTFMSSIILLSDGRLVAVGNTGPEFIGGYGGDDFDVLATVYERE